MRLYSKILFFVVKNSRAIYNRRDYHEFQKILAHNPIARLANQKFIKHH